MSLRSGIDTGDEDMVFLMIVATGMLLIGIVLVAVPFV